MTDRRPLDASAFGIMLLLGAVWGFQQVAIKVTAPEVSLLMQGAIRSIIATLLVVLWARWQGIALFARDGTLGSGAFAGMLFAIEFVFIYFGLGHTAASRMSVFVYLAPVFAALWLHLFVPGEQLASGQWLGVLLAFAGVALAFSDGLRVSGSPTVLGRPLRSGSCAAVGSHHGGYPGERACPRERDQDAVLSDRAGVPGASHRVLGTR